MIREEICTYEVAKLAKEKGFNVQTFDWYDYVGNYNKGFIPHKLHECPRYKEYYAPSQSILQRWLREEKGLHISIPLHKGEYKYFWGIDSLNRKKKEEDIAYNLFDTYELALEDALKYALENLI